MPVYAIAMQIVVVVGPIENIALQTKGMGRRRSTMTDGKNTTEAKNFSILRNFAMNARGGDEKHLVEK